MNWKKWVGVLVLLLFGLAGPRHAFADTYQLATGSATVQLVTVSSFAWTQVDNPAMAGRTSMEIYNLDTSSPIICSFNNTGSLFAGFVSTNTTAGNMVGRLIPASPATTSAIAGSNQWSLSLSNFASNRGSFPVSVPMDVFCVTAHVGATSQVIVTQTQ